MIHEKIGVVGLWHLGSVIAACWSKLGKTVHAIDFDSKILASLAKGEPPVFEPGLREMIQKGLNGKLLNFSTDPVSLGDCRFVFLAHDTPVADDDSSDISLLKESLEKIRHHLMPSAILIVSAQLPVGTASCFRKRLKEFNPTLELVYSPENLRLGEAIDCYLRPGHIVIGSETQESSQAVSELFGPMQAECHFMNLASAEMTKHGINAFLAASVVFANQFADVCAAVGADFNKVVSAMKCDPRIGKRSYLNPGLGFSGGTLGRDLQALSEVDRKLAIHAPLFGDIWRYNRERIKKIGRLTEDSLGGLRGKTITLLGVTYKPGTSTLRRSLALEVAHDLISRGASIRAYDPKADWGGVSLPRHFERFPDVYKAAEGAQMAVLLTEWPEFKNLDFQTLSKHMKERVFLDVKNFLSEQHPVMESLGFKVLTLIGSKSQKKGL